MPLSDIFTISIVLNTATSSQAGFGVPIILSAAAAFGERVRYYANAAAVLADGFATTSAEYLAAASLFAQNPRPPRVGLGRLANKPTMRWAITPAVANSTTYSMKVNGTTVSYTSDASATMAEIIAGLKAAIDALALAITVSDQTTHMRIVANVAGAYFRVESLDVSKLGVAQDMADPGIAADLAAIALENNDWYTLLNPYASSAIILAAAAWVETNKKLYIVGSQDSDIIGAGSTDVASALETAAYARSPIIYHPSNGAFADAAWAGKRLPETPGAETWKFAQLSGVPAVMLTPTQYTNAMNKHANVFYTVHGKNITSQGWVPAGEFIDIIRGRDWLEEEMSGNVFDAFTGPKKVPMTDAGIAILEGAVRAALQQGVRNGFLKEGFTVTVPAVADLSDSDIANRHISGITFDALVTGAAHSASISGTVSAS